MGRNGWTLKNYFAAFMKKTWNVDDLSDLILI